MGEENRGEELDLGVGAPVVITKNSIMQDLVEKARLAAKTRAKILLTGENGTGKEVLARLIHQYSARRNKPMVAINCGAIPSELVESELFGHEKGAFTGANSRKLGCFELAHNGTLFLDEIGEMPLSMQVKLLRVVETGSFRRVGGKEQIHVDINLISASNKILMDEVKFGCFREDLYYRLNVIELYIPPLRYRKEDIPLLTNHFLKHFSSMYDLSDTAISEDCMARFMEYDWPGNVRELKNIVERCLVLADGSVIDVDTLPPRLRRGEDQRPSYSSDSYKNLIQIPVGTSLKEIEREVINKTLSSVDNNKTEAAKILGFSRKTLHNKLDKYLIDE